MNSVFIALVVILQISQFNRVDSLQQTISSNRQVRTIPTSIRSHKTVTPLPWTSSTSPGRSLSYMPMLSAQLELLSEIGMERVNIDEKFVFRGSDVRPARIASLTFKSDKFRKIRMTYFDGGDAVQVYNTLWYPAFELDAPMLGVDLISLGSSRVLSVIDFQPLHPNEEYSEKYIDHLAPIRCKYPDLHGVLSGKIYDDTSFFSKQMLFGRFTDESKIHSVVLPAYKEYMKSYVELVSSIKPDNSEKSRSIVLERQTKYDVYSALKDPAVGLFDSYFGKEWSSDFVHKYLFELSENSSNGVAVHKFTLDTKGNVATKSVRSHSS